MIHPYVQKKLSPQDIQGTPYAATIGGGGASHPTVDEVQQKLQTWGAR